MDGREKPGHDAGLILLPAGQRRSASSTFTDAASPANRQPIASATARFAAIVRDHASPLATFCTDGSEPETRIEDA
jgi:hypothetical protein